MDYSCNTQGCPKRDIIYHAQEIVNDNGDAYTNPSTVCSHCGQPCVTNLEPVEVPEPASEPQPDHATEGVEQYETPFQAMTELVNFYSRHYGSSTEEAAQRLRADAFRLLG